MSSAPSLPGHELVSRPFRYPWRAFPQVWIHADETEVKQHPAYDAAKAGDPDAAYWLVTEKASPGIVEQLAVAFVGTVLTGKAHSAVLALAESTLDALRKKHGKDLENWWRQRFGFGFDCLTESEARYLLNTPSADRVRDQIAAAVQA